MDKAGAYGIQGAAGSFVSSIRGCYYNVMGFPMNAFCRALREMLGGKAESSQVTKEVEERKAE